MKKLLLLFTLASSTLITAQAYEIGAMTFMNTPTGMSTIKMGGDFIVGDSLVAISLKSKHGEDGSGDFDIINQRNGVTYLSDGTTTFELTFSDKSGKKKGFKYDKIAIFRRPQEYTLMYYVKELE